MQRLLTGVRVLGKKSLYRDFNVFFLNHFGCVKDFDFERLAFCGEVHNNPLGNVARVSWFSRTQLNSKYIRVRRVCDLHTSLLPENIVPHKDNTR